MKLLMMMVMTMMIMGLLIAKDVQAQGDSACGPQRALVACLPAAEADMQPEAQCCAVLRGYLTTATPEACLCEAAMSSAFASSGISVQYAIRIPQKCNLSYRAGTQCNGRTIPGGQ